MASLLMPIGNTKLVKAVLCAGLYPNVAKIESGKRSVDIYMVQICLYAFLSIVFTFLFAERQNCILNKTAK